MFDREVGAADLTDLTGFDQTVESFEGVADGRFGVGGVQLVEIDVVGFEAAQAGITGFADIGGAGTLFSFAHAETELGGDHDILAAVAEGLAHELFADTCVVHVGSIEEIDAAIKRGCEDFAGRVLADAPTEVVAAEAYDRNFQRSDATTFHDLMIPL